MHTDPKKIAIYLTNKCNLMCKHCFIEGSPINEQFLSWSQIKLALKYFKQNNYNIVEFTGGESCLSPYIIDSIKLAKKLGYQVGINTNGTNPQIFQRITPEMVNKITFSLDGFKASTHDQLRGEGVYNLCLRTIQQSLKSGYKTEVIFTVNHYNQNEIPQIIKLLDNLGVYRLSFNFISNMGTATYHRNYLLSPQKWLEAKKQIEKNSHTKNLKIRYPILFVTPNEFKTINDNKKNNYHCMIPDQIKVELYPDGYYYHCCLITDSKDLATGHITNNEVIVHDQKIKQFVKKYQHLTCPAYQIKHQLYIDENELTPFCLYCKIFT